MTIVLVKWILGRLSRRAVTFALLYPFVDPALMVMISENEFAPPRKSSKDAPASSLPKKLYKNKVYIHTLTIKQYTKRKW